MRSATNSKARFDYQATCFVHRNVHWLCYLILDDGLRQIAIERFCAAEEKLRVDESGDDECVGECGLIAAERVTRGAGKRAHAFGAQFDLGVPGAAWFHDAAAAEGDGAQVGKRDFDGDAEKVGGLAIDRLAIFENADFCGGAADVHGDDIFQAVELSEKNAGVDAENRAGFDRVDRFGLGDAGDAAVDVADEKSSGVLRGLAQFVFSFEEGGGESAVRVGVDYSAIGARAVVGAFRDVAAGEHRNRAEKMIGVLQIDRGFYFEFCGWIAMAVFQADADSADAAFEESAGRVRDLRAVE